jgi:hypothetical protein
MAAVIPLNDASRRPTRFPFVTATIIVLNVAVFLLEAISATFTVSLLLCRRRFRKTCQIGTCLL